MNHAFRISLLATLCAAVCACQPGDDNVDPDATANNGPDATVPGNSPLEGAFNCDDGTTVQLDWGEDDVTVRWPDDRSVTLPRAESASGPNGDAYVGDTVSVERDGERIVLRDGTNAAVTCNAAAGGTSADASDAAITMRYACDPDTEITVFADDSARVALPDGQQVTLSRVAGSSPPVFTGDTLFFSIGDTAAHLSQGDQTNELACEPA